MKPLVVDGSTMLGVVLKDEHSAYTARAIEALEKHPSFYVPTHWWLEIASGLLMAERRKRFSQAEISEAFHFVRAFPMEIDEQTASRSGGETLALARQYSLTIYDAAYLELALRRGSVLATMDKALARAATAAGVELLT